MSPVWTGTAARSLRSLLKKWYSINEVCGRLFWGILCKCEEKCTKQGAGATFAGYRNWSLCFTAPVLAASHQLGWTGWDFLCQAPSMSVEQFGQCGLKFTYALSEASLTLSPLTRNSVCSTNFVSISYTKFGDNLLNGWCRWQTDRRCLILKKWQFSTAWNMFVL